jgi:hypothetical protein
MIEHLLPGFLAVLYVRRRMRSRLSEEKMLSATALSWQLPRRRIEYSGL